MGNNINRRKFIVGMIAASVILTSKIGGVFAIVKDKITLSNSEWKARLSPEQFRVLRKNGTERAFSSELNNEKRTGIFHCAACDLALFNSDKKFDSGTGWPSFFDSIPNHIETKTDYKLLYPRTEYHCMRCDGHQGHIFKDGPAPTGLRYCNNGVALKFKAKL